MARSIRERTFLPPEDLGGVERLAQGLSGVEGQLRARLLMAGGSEVEVPEEVLKAVVDVVYALAQGLAVTVVPHRTMLTTQEAADLLQISRPTLVRLLSAGEIPHQLRGHHRRVMLADVLEYQERFRVERRQILDQMVADAQEAGFYDVATEPIRTR